MEQNLPERMQAWHATKYGGPEVLELRQIPVPKCGKNDVLIKVEATTVSSGDRRLRAFDFPRGLGLIGRLVVGIWCLRRPVLGAELVGYVVATGVNVTQFKVGDRVVAMTGIQGGAHAQYCRLDQRGAISRVPKDMPRESAAALAFGGSTAVQYLRRARLRAGESVLVIGAAGTVGSACVQIAHAQGAHVTGVCSTSNLEVVSKLGADKVIDYTKANLMTLGQRFDVVADAVGALDFPRAISILKENGRYLAINASVRDMLRSGSQGRRCLSGPAAESAKDLALLVQVVADKSFTPLIDSVFPFSHIPQAHARVDTGRKRGSVVIVMD